MDKKNIFSKLNFKDYNNEVEEILEKKSFSSNVKNLILSMFYKIEVAYKDYLMTKRDVTEKDGFIESIIYTIKEECNIIELINPTENQEDILAKHNAYFMVEPENKKIISYTNEQCLFHAILRMSKKNFYITNEYEIFSDALKPMLEIGYELDKKEIITSFDGWSWSIRTDVTGNSIYNLIYQNLRFLLGNTFLYEWKRDRRKSIDYIEQIRKTSEELYFQICNLCLILAFQNKQKKQNIIKKVQNLKKELEKLENKNEFLKNIYEEKKKIKDKIKIIDKILNNKELLTQELEDKNAKLPDEQKIISISSLEDIIEEDRKSLIQKLQEYNQVLDPKNYIKKVNQLKEKIKIIENLPINSITNEIIYEYIIKLQKTFINCINYSIDKIELKKDLIELIYKFRYYKLIVININNKTINIEELPELTQLIEQTQKKIITKACKNKVLQIFNQDIEYNYEIISKVVDTNIIDMENIMISLEKEETLLNINIFDKEIIDKTEKIPYKTEEYNVKFNKKLKLFI